MVKQSISEEERQVQVAAGAVNLEGNLALPEQAAGLVLFAHGSGSSRFSPRNRMVASILRAGGLATLLIDLLSAEEEEIDRKTRHLRFDIELLAQRLVGATDWLRHNPATKRLAIGYFGSSTGAAAALIAAVHRPDDVAAIVSRGGRPDLADRFLPRVQAPTLLIVGGLDHGVSDLNRRAYSVLAAAKDLQIVPGATHLFEEPGALEEVARLATNWFRRYLSGGIP
jgi:putative phosphoribosyl transferase